MLLAPKPLFLEGVSVEILAAAVADTVRSLRSSFFRTHFPNPKLCL